MSKEEEKTRGRPTRGGVASYPVSVKLTPDERALYLKAAEAEDLSLAEWIRAACEARLKRAKR